MINRKVYHCPRSWNQAIGGPTAKGYCSQERIDFEKMRHQFSATWVSKELVARFRNNSTTLSSFLDGRFYSV